MSSSQPMCVSEDHQTVHSWPSQRLQLNSAPTVDAAYSGAICPPCCWPVWTCHPSVWSDPVLSFTSPHSTRWTLTLWPDFTTTSSNSFSVFLAAQLVNYFTPRETILHFHLFPSSGFLSLFEIPFFINFLRRMTLSHSWPAHTQINLLYNVPSVSLE